MSKAPIIVWFRNDLRVGDHPALAAAAATGAPLLALYVFDEVSPGRWAPGGASRWWLDGSLAALARDLKARGMQLVLRRGDARAILPALAAETSAEAVYCSRAYEPWAAALERDLKAGLEASGIALRRFAGRLLYEPEAIRTRSGEPYRVYTPFWRAVLTAGQPRRPLPAPSRLTPLATTPASERLSDWRLTPSKPDWAGGLRAAWTPGEAGARLRLETFLDRHVARYHERRDLPAVAGTSRLSPHLAFGEISPASMWQAARTLEAREPAAARGVEVFLKELVWREFSAHLLHHYPDLPERPFRPEFAAYPWRRDGEALRAWQRGLTGYPIVDAGMRELWATGYMHNRVRMVVASFLVKHLSIPWQEGEAWFWDTLVDADLASNAASWQWVAGSGADAAPYFRIFNPVTQGAKFDADGAYVRRWVGELSGLSDTSIHAPWEAAPDQLSAAGVRLGETYPAPLVDHKAARERALAGYDAVKSAASALR
jgi:deoxyribodipyrimidine photo-lyase